MGLFGEDVDIAGAEVTSGGVVPGVYRGVVSDLTVQPGKKNPEDEFLVFEYTLEGAPFPISEWKRIPKGNPDSWDVITKLNDKGHTEAQFNEWARSAIKTRLASLGVPEDRMNTIGPDELIGLDVVVTVVQDPKSDYSRVKKVALPGSGRVTPALPKPQAPVDSTPSTPVTPVDNPFARA